jgi:hypothetical protein
MVSSWMRALWRKRSGRLAAAAVGIGFLVIAAYGGSLVFGGADAAAVTPHIGGRYAEFVAAYGKPASIGTGRGLAVGHVTIEGTRFYADAAHGIIINAQSFNGLVKNMSVTGPSSWTDQQTAAYCKRFLVPGSTAFRTLGPYTYYHSTVGDVVIFNTGRGVCEVALAPASPPA